MALKELPGGELYEENGGSYANEATARQIGRASCRERV